MRKPFDHAKRSMVIEMDGTKPPAKASIQVQSQVGSSKEDLSITIKPQPTKSADFNIIDFGYLHLF